MAIVRGLLLGRRFRLVNRLSVGRFGELWRGADRVPTRQVAIRVLPPNAANAEVARMLARVAAIHHPFLARVFDVGRMDDGGVWIATELLMGETLASLLARRRSIPAGAALRLVAEIATVVAEAHAMGIAHGSISPRAIVLHRDPHGEFGPKLVDFGRAEWLDRSVHYRYDVASLRELLLDCVARDRSDHHLDRVVEACMAGEISTASELAQRARVAANACSAGLTALLRMARVPDEYLDPARVGLIDHLPTFPGICPDGAPSEPPVLPLPAILEAQDSHDEVADEEWEEADEAAPSTSVEKVNPTAEEQGVVVAVPPPPAQPWMLYIDPGEQPSDDEPFVDFRAAPPRSGFFGARGIAVSCVAVLALAFVGTRSTPKAPASARRAPVEVAGAIARSEPAARATSVAVELPAKKAEVAAPTPPPPAAPANPTTPAGAPQAKASTLKPAAVVRNEPEQASAEIPSYAGIPLWDGPKKGAPKKAPKKPVDDNPYE